MRQINPTTRPQPPKAAPYPQYSQQEIDERLISVIRFVLSIPESRLKPVSQEQTRPTNDPAEQPDE